MVFDRIAKAFGANKEEDAVSRLPPGMRLYAIGDIHGRRDLIEEIHGKILADAAVDPQPRTIAVYLGDYIDRGLESAQVIDFLLEQPLSGIESVYLKGNHEDSLLRFLDDIEIGPPWLFYGGDTTLHSYGVPARGGTAGRDGLIQMQTALRRKLPEAHLAFYRALKPYHVEGDYLFVHAGIAPKVPLEKQSEESLLWIRDAFLESRVRHDHMVVHGHSIAEEPVVRANRIGIDTGAYASGVLTCLVLQGEERRFLQTR